MDTNDTQHAHAHSYRWSGRAEGNTLPNCDSPVVFRCSDPYCGDWFLGVCNAKVASQCEKCEKRYRGRLRAIARLPLMVAKPGSTILLTLTAPGTKRHCAAHTYLDKERGTIQPDYRCGMVESEGTEFEATHEECPCSVNRIETTDQLRAWNGTISNRWNKFITDVRRTIPGFEQVEYFRAIEPQERGALHIHAIVRLKGIAVLGPFEREALSRLAMRHGFGHEVDTKQIGTGKLDQVTAARYVAKYVSKSYSNRLDYVDRYKVVDVAPEDVTDDQRLRATASDSGKVLSRAKRWKDRLAAGVRSVVKIRLPRFWTASRKWGMSMKAVIEIQRLNLTVGLTQSEKATDNALAAVYEHQSSS